MSDQYSITQQVIERAFRQNNKVIFTAKIKAVNLTTEKTFEFTGTALNEIDARKMQLALVAAGGMVILLSMWNAGFIYQWGEHLLPVRGKISFREIIHNQFFVVPREVGTHLRAYLFKWKKEMQRIEEQDIKQMGKPGPL